MDLIVGGLSLIVVLYFARRLDQIKTLLEDIRDGRRSPASDAAHGVFPKDYPPTKPRVTIPGIND